MKLGDSTARVATFVSLAGIKLHHHRRARVAQPFYRDLVPGSPLLQQLNAEPEAPPPTRWITYRVHEDDRFAPPDGSELIGADNRAVPSVGEPRRPDRASTHRQRGRGRARWRRAPTSDLAGAGAPVRSGP